MITPDETDITDNFVVRDNLFYYVDYECSQYMEEWNFENWGIKYWSTTAEFRVFVRDTKDGIDRGPCF